MNMCLKVWILAGLIAESSFLLAVTPEVEFNRCYSRLTSLQPARDHPLLKRIKSKEITPSAACAQILQGVSLKSNGSLKIANKETKSVLANFHRLHASWFLNPDFSDLANGTQNAANRELFDIMSPAAYQTQALFSQGVNASSIWTSKESLVSLRVNMDPEQTFNGKKAKQHYIFDSVRFAGEGELLGIATANEDPLSYKYENNNNKKVFEGELAIHKQFGGGFLGSPVYLIKNVQETQGYKADGGVKMPRKWAKAVLNDVFCRELPLVKEEDVAQYVDPDSSVPFRNAAGCTSCHATMDQMAAGIRGVLMVQHSNNNSTPEFGGYFATFHQNPMAKGYDWNAIPDNNYFKYQNLGKLYFRDHKGELIDIPFDGVAELGAEIAKLDDPYMCITKRYLEHFSGETYTLSQGLNGEAKHQLLLSLARDLKKNQNLKDLIVKIIKLKK